MVTKSKKSGTKKGRVKVGKLSLNKETVKNLSAGEKRRVKGGVGVATGLCLGTGDTSKCMRPTDPLPKPPTGLVCR